MHLRPLPEIVTGFGRVLGVPVGPMSSFCPSSFFPPSSSMFLLDDLSFCGHQGSIWGGLSIGIIRSTSMTDPSPSPSLCLLCAWFCSCYSAQLVVWDGVRPKKCAESFADIWKISVLVCGWWSWSSSRILHHTIECLPVLHLSNIYYFILQGGERQYKISEL